MKQDDKVIAYIMGLLIAGELAGLVRPLWGAFAFALVVICVTCVDSICTAIREGKR